MTGGAVPVATLEYGNWIRRRNLLILALATLGTGALIALPLGSIYRGIVGVLFVVLLFSFLFPMYAYAMFSQRGGNLQEQVYDLIVNSLGPDVSGRILDIGSGNGVLAVKVAQRHREAEVVGVDFWGPEWEYSKAVCDRNARAGLVDGRVRFQKGDAAHLEFDDGSFDAATSNLTFHEVRSVPDKRKVLEEALRVVKPGGAFAFVDYFDDAQYYGEAALFDTYLSGLKLSRCERQPLRAAMALPVLLKHPKILGKVGILYGRK